MYLNCAAVILLDARLKVIDVREDIGQLDWPLQIERQPQGIRIRLIRKWIEATSDVEPLPLAVWANVGERDGKLQQEWEDR
jgi:hypothetical protein